MPVPDDRLTTITYSLEPSGHTTRNMLPGGRVANGAPLCARYAAASCVAPRLRVCSGDSTEVDATCDSSR